MLEIRTFLNVPQRSSTLLGSQNFVLLDILLFENFKSFTNNLICVKVANVL